MSKLKIYDGVCNLAILQLFQLKKKKEDLDAIFGCRKMFSYALSLKKKRRFGVDKD